jgi:hypothetical protein
MRASRAFFSAAVAVVFSMEPRFAEAGPCSNDISELETAIQQPGVNPLSGPPQLSHQRTPELVRRADERLQSQFAATIARAKRLDMKGQRVGCIGAINAARRMYVLVDKQSSTARPRQTSARRMPFAEPAEKGKLPFN